MYSTPLKNRYDYGATQFVDAQQVNGVTNNNIIGSSNGVATGNMGTTYKTPGPLSTNVGIRSTLNYPPSLDSSILTTTTEHVRIPGLASAKPLELASQYVDHLYRMDANTPILDERSYYNNGVNYNFTKEVGGLGAFTPFERQKVVSIPDDILQEASNTELKSDMGIFPEIDRCWFTIDNRIILWNINDSTEYQTIDDIKHAILKIQLVKPKPNTFVSHVKHLLVVATVFDIYILAVSYKKETNELSIFNTGMSVNVQGMNVNNITCYEKTGQIFFSGKSNGLNVWELQYTGSDDWFNSKCTKSCRTQSTFSSLLPTNILSKLPGSNLVQSMFDDSNSHGQESIIQITIDQSRGILYTLSSTSKIHAYIITGKSLEGAISVEPSYIKRIIGATTARGAPILAPKYLKLAKLSPVVQAENGNLFLVAITIGGVRLYFNGFVGRTSIEALRLESIKFPPSSVTPEILQKELEQQQLEQQKRSLPFYSTLNSTESVVLKFQKKSSVLLETTTSAEIISPGIFFSAVVKNNENNNNANQNKDNTTPSDNKFTEPENKLFVSVPDYGILKTFGKYVENATFLDTVYPVKEIKVLTKTFNASNKPEGYANTFATQYSSEELKIAVLTNSSLEIYRYRTPDEIFESLIDNPLPFILNYGLTEACSSALFVTCKFDKSELLRSKALTFYTVGIPGAIDIKPSYSRNIVTSLLSRSSLSSTTPQKSTMSLDTLRSQHSSRSENDVGYDVDDVILSPRFYGSTLLITRLFRDVWRKNVFVSDPKVTSSQTNNSSKENNVITNISVSKSDIEYYLSSISILGEFFTKYGDTIATVSSANVVTENGYKTFDKSEDVANQAESIAFNSLFKLVQSMKEALSFLNVLFEESEMEGIENPYAAFKDIIGFLNRNTQLQLSRLTFKDLFSPNENTRSLLREILLSIINRNISRGTSIEYIASALQERCGSFCSSDDILSFRATEHLRKAKEIGLKDSDTLKLHLNSAVKLFESIAKCLSMEKLREITSIMLSLDCYAKTIEFLLNIANAIDKGNLAAQYVDNGSLINDERKKFYDRRIQIYDLVFEVLVKVDQLSVSPNLSYPTASVCSETDIAAMRTETYRVILNYNDKLFHYHMYDWLVRENNEDKILQLDTRFILPYLQEKSQSSLQISNIMWIYLSKKSRYYQAAQVLYSLAISNFEIKLSERIECLSRANGFCNSACQLSEKQKMIQLASDIQEVLDIATVQEDILSLVLSDSRIDPTTKSELQTNLEGKILPVSDLFNDYAEPLGYHEICICIFKVSDFRDQDEIMSKWHELFDSLKKEVNFEQNPDETTNFLNLLSNVVIKIGRTVHTSEYVFPITELFPIICDIIQSLPQKYVREGFISSIFISAGISYSKLYYIIKDLIETSDSVNELFKKEMISLIKNWYENDAKVRDAFTYEEINNLSQYEVSNDPINKFVKRTGLNL